MIPGTVSKISERNQSLAASMDANVDMIRVSSTADTTQFATLVPKSGLPQQILFIANASGGTIQALTTGNIIFTGAMTLPASKVAGFLYSRLAGGWYPMISA